MSQDQQPMREARGAYVKKCAQFSGTNLGIGVHFDAGWKARQNEVDQQAAFIKQIADTCEEAEKLTLQARSQRDELQSRLKSAEFWKGVYPEGWTAERVENEMTDFHALMDGIPSLYMHITGGKVSKELTDKSVIKSLHDDYVTELVEEATQELEQQRDELLAVLRNIVESCEFELAHGGQICCNLAQIKETIAKVKGGAA